MAKESAENLPDIDAGLSELSQETTAADLLRQQGQRKKLKVINRNQLKAQIQEWIRKAVEEGVADHAGSLSQEERDAIMRQTEERVQEAMRRSQQAEAQRLAAEEERGQLASRVNQLADEHNANEALKQSILQLQERLQRAELVADESQQDVLAMEQDLENIQKMHQATRHEKEKLEDTLRQHMLHTTDLVSLVLGMDNDYYGGKHQTENAPGEDLDPADAFFHDFQVGAKVTETLSSDLGRLREITEQKAESEAQPQLLAEDLALLEQLKSGSLDAVELSAPVENLVEALDGARGEVVALQQQADGQAGPITALPAEDGDAAEVLQGATHVVREMTAALAAARTKLGALSGESSEKAKQALRENMIRTTELVQGVLVLDNQYYGSRHQNEHPVPEGVEGQDEFYHDFDVGAKVIETLSRDLARLSDLTKDQEKYSGLLDSDLALLEQLKEGSLQAMDVAAPVGNLVEALDGARSEASALGREADEALHLPSTGAELSALPDPDGKPDEVLAGATRVARELATAFATERKRLQALRALADQADAARQGSEQELEGARQLLGAIAEQGRDFGVVVPAELEDDNAAGETRVAAAQSVLDGLHRKLEEEAAAVDDLSTTLESLMGEEAAAAEAGEREQAADQRAVLGELKTKIDTLGERYQRLRKAYVGSRAREQALADQLQALARDLDPEMAEDDASELGKLSQALAAQPEEEPEASAVDEQRSEQLGSAIDGLIASLRTKAAAGGIGGAPSEEVEGLAREVVEIAKADEDVAGHEATVDLAMGLDAEGSDKPDAAALLATTRRVVEVLSARRTVLAEDLTAALEEKERLLRRSDELEQRIHDLNADLEGERTGRQAALSEVSESKEQELATLRAELEDSKEALLSGKEIIGHLNEKEQRHSAELEALKTEQEQLRAEVQAKATRLVKAESANRQLTETLSEVSQGLLQHEGDLPGTRELEEARVELEVALSELPAEESPDIQVREDIADDLAAGGRQVIERIRQREAALIARLGEVEQEKTELERARDEARAAGEQVKAEARSAGDELGKAEARIGLLQQEVEEANQAVTAKRKEVGQLKEELATTKADLESAQRRAAEQDEQINALQADTSEADKVRVELEQAREELRQAYEGERAIAGSLSALAGWAGEVVGEFELQKKRESQRYTRSRDKLEQAVEAGDSGAHGAQDLVERSKELAEQVQGQAALITEHLREQREKIATLYADSDTVRGRISSLEASIADKEYQLSQTREEAERIQGEVDGAREEAEASQTEAARQRDLLRQAKAALDEYKAREGEHAGGIEGQVQKLRDELEQERSGREEVEARLSEVREDLESTIAGLRARTEELDRRIAERDEEIMRLQGQLDDELSQRLDTAEGKARLQALQAELESEKSLRKELERQVDEFKGGVGAEMSKAQSARGELMEKLRKLEGELGEQRGKAEALKASKENLRKDLALQMDKLKGQLTAEREAKDQLETSERSLREELAGLRARLRTLTSSDEE